MEEFDFILVAQKSIKGVAALISRTFLIQLLGIVTFLIISARLEPEIFGIYIIAQSVLMFFNYFQDVGLAASLIQKKENPTINEYRSVFTLQQILVLLLVVPSIIFSPQIASFYNLDENGRLLLIALLVTFFLTSLRTIPTVILERQLNFGRLVIPQIAENLVFNGLLIMLVLMGFGIEAFTISVLSRGVVGLIATYIIQPWKIGLKLDIKPLKELLSFGVPFQTNNVLALLKDDLLTVYIGKILPFTQVGYIGFAQKIAFYPLRLVMDNVIRITFPSYSRLQHDRQALKIAIEKSLFLISAFIFPTAGALIALSPKLIETVPRYSQWEPALLAIMFFALNTVFSSISTPLTNFLNAIGKVKITLYFMAFWTSATWILTIYLIGKMGYNGVAIASFLVSLTSIFVFAVTRKYVKFSFLRPVGRQFIAAVGMFVILIFIRSWIDSVFTLIIISIIGGISYIAILTPLAYRELLLTTRFIMKSIRNK